MSAKSIELSQSYFEPKFVTFMAGGELIIGQIIGESKLEKDMMTPAVDESHLASIIPAGTSFSEIVILQGSNLVPNYEPGKKYTYQTDMLNPIKLKK